MADDSCPRVISSESDSLSTTKQRKRRKWDQPDESLVSSGISPAQNIFPLANVGCFAQITLPSVPFVAGAPRTTPLSTSTATPIQVAQPKIQDEVIAREIVINDADSTIRYKLTKRQTQEEIQRSTGAVVITRGKYRPPEAPSDSERPLYLHISAGAHLETTAERIKAVDHAFAIVEDMLKQTSVNSGMKIDHLLHTCVYLGFEADPSLNINSRIRGPNDQYVNHIMNETGVTVLLRGRGSGYFENGQTEETQQPLHLLLSSNDPKCLERAKLLAENLLDTISAECGASRVSSGKVYGAVPPPPQLQAGVLSPVYPSKVDHAVSLSSPALVGVGSTLSLPDVSLSQSIGLSNPGLSHTNTTGYHHGLINGTSYIGYGGIYPQATPLQQVALALRQSTSPVNSTIAPTATASSKDPPADKQSHSQKRKFQELPAAAKVSAIPNQVFSLTSLCEANMLILGHLCWTFACFTGFLLRRWHEIAACCFNRFLNLKLQCCINCACLISPVCLNKVHTQEP
ncbi:protein RIK isoform X2 [Andrographis paniculata]|uniref:protein RIK isoform X2 n=1 Tax=Andrographis paniculata TaxID=175694 RepID=UPI0021E911B5|nr:protein RIK isoform X2 [Andrographis paniculata]